jgi:hypothetical protein
MVSPSGVDVVVNERLQSNPKLAASSMEPAANGTDRDIQQGTDLLIATTVKVFQDHHRAMVRPQFAQRCFNDGFSFEALQGQRWVAFRGSICCVNQGQVLPLLV